MKKLLLLPLLVLTSMAYGQKKGKKPTPPPQPKKALTHSVYDGWKSITYRTLSNDGDWAIYTANPQEGDGNAIFYGLKKSKIDSVQRAADIRVSYDSEVAVFKIKPQAAVVRDAKRKKKKREDMPKDSLGIYSLKTSQLTKIPKVSSFALPEKAGGFVAYQLETPAAKRDTTARRTNRKPAKKESEENGYQLVLKNLKSGTQTSYSFVTDYAFSKNGKRLAYVTTGNDSTVKLPGVYVVDLANGSSQKVFEAKGKTKKLSFDEAGDQLAFVTDPDTNAKSLVHYHQLYYWKSGQAQALKVADQANQPGPKGWLVSGDAPLAFAKNGSKLFFGTAPVPAVADTTMLPEEVVNVEVWGPKDRTLQPQQKVTAERDKKRSYTAVYDPATNALRQLATTEMDEILPVADGNADYVVALSDLKYSHEHWDWNSRNDAYVVSTKDGSKKLIGENIRGNIRMSPEGKYAYWFSLSDTAWFAHSIATGKTVQLTKDRKFADEDDDHPDFPRGYGSTGWTKGDALLYIYDKYDVWTVDPANPTSLTRLTKGREVKKTYRFINLDPEDRGLVDPSKPQLVHLFDHTTKASGYAQWSGSTLTVLHQGDFAASPMVTKAKNTNDLLFTKTTFREYPDLMATDLSFKNIRKISNLGEQTKAYRWGTVEMVSWVSGDGVTLQGLLYKPDDFDSTKKYPMITYFYEKESDNIHNFVTPAPTASARNNYAYSVSNGYIVFVPDIVYQDGYPGPSAYSCIIPGVLKLLENPWVDRTRLGIVGHSWGGYQTAYLITKTNLFKTAVPGAPVANMTSAYGGIRWGTGLSRQAQYEHTQSRIGGTLWEKTQQYLDNSPLFYLPNVQTPALILHNDEDDAVPWYQGIELYVGLKRLGKPAWMLNYNTEKHGLRVRKNQKDWTIRMWQYLDHYLKDAPAPQWMVEGLPMIEKGVNQRLEPAAALPSAKATR
ncbi:S9 family peptidase [Siphonobacter curvatus]|uniref:S9 family peptidase n=1 Tax=Siphonobacter curvatus TaxID=2094562 RepID=A0A2S7ISQ4_9BACT|nr:prolyl oligopeptidase family serine peptidase [Siphonobacter curvatus]PQA60716.1 S9 family peptidase [Siphonobacter curvatus]